MAGTKGQDRAVDIVNERDREVFRQINVFERQIFGGKYKTLAKIT